jgi:tetratricopeptide (TPR) repeat protein
MSELPAAVHEKLKELCTLADVACEEGNYPLAVSLYKQAWALIPEPQLDWNASTWVLAAIADAYLYSGDFGFAKVALEYAMHCPNGLGNPYLHLRLGQACFELNETDKAADELARAYMGGGAEVFEGQDGRYLAFLKTRMII